MAKEKLCFIEEYEKYFDSFGPFKNDSNWCKRLYSVVIDKEIDEVYRNFLAEPVVNSDIIEWYADFNKENTVLYRNLEAPDKEKYKTILNDTIQHYQTKINSLKPNEPQKAIYLEEALKHIDEDFIYCSDNYVILGIWGMKARSEVDEVTLRSIIKDGHFSSKKDYDILFEASENGSLTGSTSITKKFNDSITSDEVPTVNAHEGYEFVGWSETPENHVVKRNKVFTAKFAKKTEPTPTVPPPSPDNKIHSIYFSAGENGVLDGNTELRKRENEYINASEIPTPSAEEGFEFASWDEEPNGHKVTGDKTFVARYNKITKKPFSIILHWYTRFWNWLRTLFSGGCLRWLLWLLLFLLLLWLLWFLLGYCERKVVVHPIPYPIENKPFIHDDPYSGRGGIYNPGEPYTPIETPKVYEDILPPNEGVLTPLDTNNIHREPGQPVVLDNVLNILMENEDKSVKDFARDFKNKYPNDNYKVIYYDDVVKRLQIEVPRGERIRLKEELPQQFAPDYDIFVFDETLFESQYIPNDPAYKNTNNSWYFDAINAPKAWNITKGDNKITIAVVDNSFNLKHPEFKNKVVMPYNVWKHSPNVTASSIVDHGTHVAGTALAIMDNNIGLCGIAPNLAFMPIQVADQQGMATITSLLDGMLYALYQGADVINVSMAMQFFQGIPENVQQDLKNFAFKEEERVWNKVMDIANKHNAIVVMAAGNDNVLAAIDPTNRPRDFIVVAATDKDNRAFKKAGFSNYGSHTTVSAPGVAIYSTYGKDGYKVMEGTSMAAPIVSGAVALLKSIQKDITVEEVICVLQNTGKATDASIGNLIQIDKALEMVKTGDYKNCEIQQKDPHPSTGDVQILLEWNNYNDLDLICIDPYGDAIFFENKRVPSGGQLEIDMNARPGHTNTAIENIYWPRKKAPNGRYEVFLLYYKQHERSIDKTPYKITVRYGDKTEVFTGEISKQDREKFITSFILGEQTENNTRTERQPSDDSLNQLEKEKKKLEGRLNRINKELENIRNKK